jgi:ribose-phosphate pyrophosphokinase
MLFILNKIIMSEFHEKSKYPLHIIWTDETKILSEKIVSKLNKNLSIDIPKWILNVIEKNMMQINKSLNCEIITINWAFEVSKEIIGYDKFANEETKIVFNESVRGKHVYLVCDVNWKINSSKTTFNDKLQQAQLILHTAKKHGAKTINVIFTCFPYSRQDKPTQAWLKDRAKREASSTQFVVEILEMLWIDYCITIDIHNTATTNAFKQTNFVNLYTWWFVQEVINKINKSDIVLSWTDEWCIKKTEAICKDLKLKNIVVLKTRDYSQKSVVTESRIFWDIEWKNVVIHDDILDTWWSLVSLIEEMKKKNPTSINIAITHWRFNDNAIEKLTKIHDEWMFENIYVTNTVYRENLPDFVKVVDASNIFANTITSIFQWESINYNNNK